MTSKIPLIYSVTFQQCGAEFHPAFDRAHKNEDGTFTLTYPIHLSHLLKSEKAQRQWADEKVKHIRSWGVQAIVKSNKA